MINKISTGVALWLGLFYTQVFAQNKPELNCYGLPGCAQGEKNNPSAISDGDSFIFDVIGNAIGSLIEYVAVVAVLALMFSGIMYLVSGGEEEKVKRAKTWITWSLVGVFISISAWGIISILNNISISA